MTDDRSYLKFLYARADWSDDPQFLGTCRTSLELPLSDCRRRTETFLGSLERVAAMVDQPLNSESRSALEGALRYFREAAPQRSRSWHHSSRNIAGRMRSMPPWIDLGGSVWSAGHSRSRMHWSFGKGWQSCCRFIRNTFASKTRFSSRLPEGSCLRRTRWPLRTKWPRGRNRLGGTAQSD